MKILILSQSEVEALMPVDVCVGLMETALADLANGRYHQPLRWIMRPPQSEGLLGLMPAYAGRAEGGSDASGSAGVSKAGAFGLKAVGVFNGNPARGLDSHQGGVFLFSAETGQLLALMNASAITAIRTAAVSGVATRLLARPEAGDLAIIGAGVQARTHLAAMAAVRTLRRVRVCARELARAQSFADEMRAHSPVPIEPVAGAEEAIRGADLIVTVTNSSVPVLARAWIASGAHINAVGSSFPRAREIDSATMSAASLFVDRRESTLNEAGDYLFAVKEGVIGPESIRAELGEILTGRAQGRRSPEEITLFKSLGLATEDLASAAWMYDRAAREQAGTWVEF